MMNLRIKNLYTFFRMGFILIVGFIVFQPTVYAATLHAIIVADTHDPRIGESVLLDVKKINTLLKTVSNHAGLSLRKQVFKGDSLSWNESQIH